jgi:hypothetical protein
LILSTAREREVLVRLGLFRSLNTFQLERFLVPEPGLTAESKRVITKRILAALRKRGLVVPSAHLIGGPGGGSARLVYHLTDAGQRAAAVLDPTLSLRERRRPGSLFVEHTLMCAEAALAFHHAARAHPGHELSEWRADWQIPELLGSSRVVPDALLTYSTRTWEFDAFVELDLGSERPRRFSAKIAAYLDLYRRGAWRRTLRAWPLVLTITRSEARASALKRATEELLRRARDAGRLSRVEFDFTALPALLGSPGPLGAIWQVAGREGLHQLIPDDAEEPTADRQSARAGGAMNTDA